jgi:hypothetical protein
MIWNDTLHVIYRGFLPEFLGSALMELAAEKVWLPSRSLQDNLDRAYSMCRDFLSSSGLGRLSLDDFAKSSFDNDHNFPALPGKAQDSKLIALWLPSQTRLLVQKTDSDHNRVLDVFHVCSKC